jgi:hypothetical protein
MTTSTSSSTNTSSSWINEVRDPLPPPYKLDLGLSPTIFFMLRDPQQYNHEEDSSWASQNG